MNARLLGLLAETPIHVGTANGSGVIDLPVAREAVTDYPVIPGSGLKGALRNLFLNSGGNVDDLFGRPDRAGALIISDARILLLPVRSLHGAYRWVTSPYILERYMRDARRAGHDVSIEIPYPERGEAVVGPIDSDRPVSTTHIFLEERQFKCSSRDLTPIINGLTGFIYHAVAAQRLNRYLTILHDDDFAWFARYALMVSSRNELNRTTKTSKNLWYEEAIPTDTVFMALVAERLTGADALAEIEDRFSSSPYMQVGGNETVGHGVVSVRVYGGGV